MPIRILSPEIASQIAAGEVIERPASVVKELVENSLDAQSSQIIIKTRDAGRTLIEVSDDGMGIPAEEIPLAIERHGTSKLENAEDLFHIATLGFRGEALASIGSVSQMTLTSRHKESDLAMRLKVEGGHTQEIQRIGAPTGTVVQVENLFYNIPARLKFLKKEITERRLIETLTARYALAFPYVRFRLEQEGRLTLQTAGNGNRREILGALYGSEIARQMLEVLYKDDLSSINGFIGPTSITRTHRRELHFFINGRPVQDPSLSAALLKGYHSLLMVGRYPVAVLLLEINPEIVDVNVHPTKAEVRFRDPDRIFTSVQSAVRRALLAHNPVPGLETEISWGLRPSWEKTWKRGEARWGHSLLKNNPSDGDIPIWSQRKEEDPLPALANVGGGSSQALLPDKSRPILRQIGQIASTFIAAEGPDGLYLIDQHAAHERILYERFMSQIGRGVPTQILLQPVSVELTPSQAVLLEEQIGLLNQLGFEIEGFGSNTYLIRKIPSLGTDANPEAAIKSVVEIFEEDETTFQNHAEARLVARICKRFAIKAGKKLTPEEQRALLVDLENCQSPRTCPHGRPTMIHLSIDLLERQFGRRGAR